MNIYIDLENKEKSEQQVTITKKKNYLKQKNKLAPLFTDEECNHTLNEFDIKIKKHIFLIL